MPELYDLRHGAQRRDLHATGEGERLGTRRLADTERPMNSELGSNAAFIATCLVTSWCFAEPQPDTPKPARRERGCIALLLREAVPADAEWSWWLSGGGGKDVSADSSATRAEVGAGGEVTFGLLRYGGFPSGPYGRKNGDAELRWGPWIAGSTNFHGAFGEGGMKVHLGAIYHASWGTFDLRAGAGYGVFDDRGSPHVVGTLAYGVRSFRERYRERGACDPEPVPSTHGYGSVLRLFATVRRPLELEDSYQVILGIELTPSLFFPPLSWFQLAGGPPP